MNIYSPTEDEEDKNRLYEYLDTICDQVPKHDDKIVMGDANATIGKEEEKKAYIMTTVVD